MSYLINFAYIFAAALLSSSCKFSSRFTNKSGINYTRMFYNMDMTLSPFIGESLLPVYGGDGSTGLVTAYSSNAFNIKRMMNKYKKTIAHIFEQIQAILFLKIEVKWDC